MRRPAAGDDRGATLLELVVAMAIMVVFLAIFTTTMLMMSRSESKARSVADTANQVNQAFLWFDKSVRYAAAISTPGTGSTTGDWYVEWRNTGTGTEVCTQARLDKASGQLQRRSWQPTATGYSGLTAWVPVASGLASTSDQPFTSPSTAKGSQVYQQLQVVLTATGGTADAPSTANSSFTFTAVNSSFPVPSGVCQEAGRP
jgi:prepilin-type N-terminal cleavage/methylation domain-containing protein